MANVVLYGFADLENVLEERVADVGAETVEIAIARTLAYHNEQMDLMLATFAEDVVEPQTRYRQSTRARLQPGNETSRALPVLPVETSYTLGYPLQKGDIALGITWLAARQITVEQVNNRMNTILLADRRWVSDHIKAAIFNNASWIYADEEWGDLTVYGPANGDAQTYVMDEAAETTATDNHLAGQAEAIGDGVGEVDPFPGIYDELMEHPENDGEVISLVPTNLKPATMGLAGFYMERDPRLDYGGDVTTLRGGLLDIPLPGMIYGYHDSNVWLAEWRALPDNYIVSFCTEGPRPLGMRQQMEAELRGFINAADRNDYPYYESQYTRMAGFGAFNRAGVHVLRVGNSSYATPTGYSSPMP